jgi:hypothetical protein
MVVEHCCVMYGAEWNANGLSIATYFCADPVHVSLHARPSTRMVTAIIFRVKLSYRLTRFILISHRVEARR